VPFFKHSVYNVQNYIKI